MLRIAGKIFAPQPNQRSYLANATTQPASSIRPAPAAAPKAASSRNIIIFSNAVRYPSIPPTNHAIDFMVGFIGPFTCGATVVHLRTLRPEFIREAFTKYKITYMALVPMVLKNLERGLRQRFAELPSGKRKILNALIATNRAL